MLRKVFDTKHAGMPSCPQNWQKAFATGDLVLFDLYLYLYGGNKTLQGLGSESQSASCANPVNSRILQRPIPLFHAGHMCFGSRMQIQINDMIWSLILFLLLLLLLSLMRMVMVLLVVVILTSGQTTSVSFMGWQARIPHHLRQTYLFHKVMLRHQLP